MPGLEQGRERNDVAVLSQCIKVLIVDDHPIIREGLASVIGNEADLAVVAEAGTGSEAVALFRQHRPDVTLMDLQMPDMDGIAATPAIRSEFPAAKVVMLTTYRGDAQAFRALKAGASGYLLKSMFRTNLLEAIRAVHAGIRYIPREVAAELAAHVTDDALSTREIEVLRRIAAGGSNKVIAAQLFLSEDTIKSHVRNIMSKLAANDRTHAVTIALKRGVIDM